LIPRIRNRKQRIQQLRRAHHGTAAGSDRTLDRYHTRARQPDDVCGGDPGDIPACHQQQQLANDGDGLERPKLNPSR
jgi:hypothetical protein